MKKILFLILVTLLPIKVLADYKIFVNNNQSLDIPEGEAETPLAEDKFKYLRIEILANNGDPDHVSLGEINWVIQNSHYPTQTITGYENSPSPYIVSDNGFLGTDPTIYGGWKLYDDNSTGPHNRWLQDISKLPAKIDIYLGQEFDYSDLASVQLTPASYYYKDPESRSVSHFKVYISNDGINWVEKLEVNNIDASEWQAEIKNSYQF